MVVILKFNCGSLHVFINFSQYFIYNLEFYVQSWSPCLIKDIVSLENCATKLVHGLSSMPYQNRLKLLGLYSIIVVDKEVTY